MTSENRPTRLRRTLKKKLWKETVLSVKPSGRRYPKTIWSDGVNYYFDYSGVKFFNLFVSIKIHHSQFSPLQTLSFEAFSKKVHEHGRKTLALISERIVQVNSTVVSYTTAKKLLHAIR